MMNAFDDLARAIASGISRREALKRMGTGLAGLMLSSLGIRRAAAAVTCGTCQACDLDTSSCSSGCTPATAGSALCTMAGQDGSYLRLVNHLTTNGFEISGASDTILFYQSGQQVGSGLATGFTNTGTPSDSALLVYSVTAAGDIYPFVFVSQDGVTTYGLNVDYDGRVIQTIFTQQTSAPTTAVTHAHSAPLGTASKALPALSSTKRRSAAAIQGNEVVTDLITYTQICNFVVDKICGWAAGKLIVCEEVGTFICALANIEDGELLLPACEALVTYLCKKGSSAGCSAAASELCSCQANTQACSDPSYPSGCCPACMDCQGGTLCVPNETCTDTDAGPCCGNVCCPENYTCDTTTNPPTCQSPNSGCLGATCATFVPCSSSNPDCVCGTITEGGGLCVPGSTPCAGLTPCSSTADCGADALCLIGSCCGEPVCVPIALSDQCPSAASAAARAPGLPANSAEHTKAAAKPSTWHGPTIGHR